MTAESNQSRLAVLLKEQKENYSPILQRELYTQLAKEYKIQYECFRREGFTMNEALRLVVKYFE